MARSFLLFWLLSLCATAFGIVANYDDLKFKKDALIWTIPIGGENTKAGTPFVYKGLSYINWYQGYAYNGTAFGIVPTSKPNLIGSSQYDPITQGAGEVNPPKRISIADPRQSFDLIEFSYGCSGLSGLPYARPCVIGVTGTYANGKGQVPTATFAFYPISQLRFSPMFKARLPDWFKGLKEVTIGAAGNPGDVHAIDDLTYNINGAGGGY